MSKKISSKILLNTKNPLPQFVKNPTSKSSAAMTKSALVQPKKKVLIETFHKSSSQKPKKPYRYFQKKDASQFRKKKYNRYFICKKRRHFTRNCPNKLAKIVRLIQYLQQSSILSDNEDVESIFSE